MTLTSTARRRTTPFGRLALVAAAAALTASLAACGTTVGGAGTAAGGAGTAAGPANDAAGPAGDGADGAVPIATFKERMVKAAGGSPVVYGFAYGNDTSGGGALSILKDGHLQLIGLDGEADQTERPDSDPPLVTIAAEKIPVEQIAMAREGVACEDKVPATVDFTPLPTGKVLFLSECRQKPQKQILDGKAVPELDDPLSAETLTTVLKEQQVAMGLTTFAEISILAANGGYGSDATITFKGTLKTATAQCTAELTRHLTVKDAAVAGIAGPGCVSDTRDQPFSLSKVTAKQLASALAKGAKAAGGHLKGATIHAGSNKIPVIDILSTEGMARVDLNGKPIG